MDILTPKEILERIALHLHISIAELSEKVGYERPQAFYDVINGKTKGISSKIANRIKAVYPEFTLDWILTGRGSMLNTESIAPKIPSENENEVIKELRSTIISQQKTIDRLTEMLYEQKKKVIDVNMDAEVADAM